jgi:signal transduction histidine kinase/ActR/RegA family two-component response regulator
MLAPDALPNTPITEPRARARLWDIMAGLVLATGAGFDLFVVRAPGPPWLAFTVCMAVMAVFALAYWPRGRKSPEASYARWLGTAQPTFELLLLVLLTGSGVLGFYGREPEDRTATLALALVLLGLALVAIYAVYLRPGLPWVEPLAGRPWWTVAVLFGVVFGLTVAIAPAAGLFQVPLLVVLWASSDHEGAVGRLIAGCGLATTFILLGIVVSRGLLTAILCEVPGMLLSVVVGIWLRGSWRWSAERRTLMSSLDQALGQLSAAEREAGVMAERERMSREIHDTIAQSLVGIIMTAQRTQRRLAVRVSDDPGLMEDLAVIIESAFDSLSDARALVAEGAHLDLSGPLEGALADLGARFARETGINVETEADLPRGLPQPVRLLVVRAVQEGLANVRKHTSAKNATAAAVFSDGSLRIQVVDDGAGLAAQPTAGGFGLAGLRDRVEVLGGRVELRNRRDRPGAVLSVEVDAIALSRADGGLDPAGDNGATSLRVLVADDHPIVRTGLVDLLGQEPDIEVVGAAGTGEDAVRLALETAPDVVMMDLEMPGKGGVWAIAQILSDAAAVGRETSVVAVTVFESDARVARAVRAGASEYIVKASSPEVFAQAVRRTAAGRSGRSPRPEAALAVE